MFLLIALGAGMLTLNGRLGKSVSVKGSTITIAQGGLWSDRREKTIPIKNVTSVEVKRPGLMFAGFIQFSFAGSIPRDSSFTISGGAVGAAQDENSVLFSSPSLYETALKIKAYIEQYDASHSGSFGTNSVADEISKLKQLLDQGLINLEDFESQKQKLLKV